MYKHQKFTLSNFIECNYLCALKKIVNEENINQRILNGRPLVQVAIITHQIQVLDYFLSLKPDFWLKDEDGVSAYDLVLLKKSIQVNQLLNKYGLMIPQNHKIDYKLINNLNLQRRIQLNLEIDQKILLDKKQCYNRYEFNRSLLHIAAISSNQKVYQHLLKYFTKPIEDQFGFTPLHYIYRNPYSRIQVFLKNENKYPIQNEDHQVYDVIVIGCGAAGIGASDILKHQGVNHLILQARDRIGGRIYSQKLEGLSVDMGASFVHSVSKHNLIYKKVNQLKWPAKTGQAHNKNQILLEQKGPAPCHLVNESLCFSQDYFKFVDKKAQCSEIDLSIQQAGKQYINKRMCKINPPVKKLFDLWVHLAQNYENATIQQMSATHYEDREDEGGDFVPKGSYYQLINKIFQSIQPTIKFKTEVIEINYESDHIKVMTKKGDVFKSKKLISTIPLGLLKTKRINFNPQLPQQHQQAIQKLGFGVMNKVIVSFQKPFWDKNTRWIRIACSQKGKFATSYNLSTQDQFILCCFITGTFAKKVSQQTDEEIIQEYLALLQKTFKNDKIKIKNYIITRWNKDEFCQGSYTFFAVNSSIKQCKVLRAPIQNKLWLAGDYCYGEHIGTAHGAFKTGVWAAEQIIEQMKQIY